MGIFKTQREMLVERYEKSGGSYVATTQPYHSTRGFMYRVADFDDTRDLAFAVAEPGSNKLDFFNYGVGQRFTLAPVPGVAFDIRATEAHTNLGRDKSTNGAQDFVIEGLGFHCRGYRTVIDPNDAAQLGPPADTTVLEALGGQHPLIDPGSVANAAQVQSPFNLEHPMFQGLLGYCSIFAEFDRGRIERLGAVDMLPQAGGGSYLRANGVPSPENVYRIDEGYLWRRDGEPDSEFVLRVALEEEVVCPLNLATDLADGTTAIDLDFIVPEAVLRMYGIGFRLPSSN